VKAGVAIFQVFYGSWELYIARGRQFERYGYTAFSLTVVPYIAMSLLNLLATILEPHYPCVFLVQHKEDVQREEEEIQPVIREINDLMGGAVAVGEAPTESAMSDTFYGDHSMLSAFRANNNDQYRKSRFSRSFGVVSNIAVSDISATNPRFAAQVFRDCLTWKTILLAYIATVLGIGAYLAPYVVAFILTRFEPQQSCCIYRSQPEMSLVWPERRCLVWPERRCLVCPEWRCLVWPETVMSCMAGDDC